MPSTATCDSRRPHTSDAGAAFRSARSTRQIRTSVGLHVTVEMSKQQCSDEESSALPPFDQRQRTGACRHAIRALSQRLRRHADFSEVAITGGSVAQEVTTGPLLVSLRGGATLHFSGGRELLAIVWDALDGVAEQAETAEDRSINRHQHIEYFSGDEHRSPDSVPLAVVADWPE